MGESNKPNYQGINKYPGWIATIITIIVGGIFIGALVLNAGHHDDGHGEHADHSAESPKDGKAH